MPADSIAWLNGRVLPAQEASLSIFDAGVTTGASVTERLRTFGHKPFLLEEHLSRLVASAEATFVRLREPPDAIRSTLLDVVERNAASASAEEDLVISVFATDGVAKAPTLCIAASPIPARDYADFYQTGIALVTPSTLSMPAEVISPQAKTRNRLHWHIADRQANEFDRGAKALLVDREGFVTETSTGNVFIVRDRGLVTPRRNRTLRGISQAYILALAAELRFAVTEADLTVEDVLNADEAFLTSSVYCMLPIVRLNLCAIGDGTHRGTYQELLSAWSNRVGIDIAGQMTRMASEWGRPHQQTCFTRWTPSDCDGGPSPTLLD